MGSDATIERAYSALQAVFDRMPHSEKPPGELTQKQITATMLVSRTVRTAEAMYRLWQHGLPEDMATLLRGVIENDVTLRYLKEKGTEEEAEHFAARVPHKKLQMARTMIRLYPESKSAGVLKSQLPELERQAEEARGILTSRKPLPSTEKMARAIGFDVHDLLWPDFSSYTHPDAYQANSYVREEDGKWVVVNGRPDHEGADNMMSVALVFVGSVIETYAAIHELGVADSEFKAVLDELDGRSRAKAVESTKI